MRNPKKLFAKLAKKKQDSRLDACVNNMCDDANLTAVFRNVEEIRLENRPTPSNLKSDQVLIRMNSVGICGTEIHLLTHGTFANFEVTSPLALGHEGAGVVVKIGTEVSNLSIGDKVAIEPVIPCRKCRHCKSGNYNLCQVSIAYVYAS